MKIADNTLPSLVKYFKDELNTLYGASELNQLLQITLNHYFNISKIDLALGIDRKFSESDLLKIIYVVKGLKQQKPLAYLLNEWEFYSLKLKVNEYTLIPRPETEELVHLIIEENKKCKNLIILDIGTGSGCIALALKKHLPFANIFAWDVDEETLQITKENATLNQLKIDVEQVDILKSKEKKLACKIDVIVSNPPYIPFKEKQLIKKNVLDFEPHLALFVEDNNPLIFYDAISDFAWLNLKPNGKLYFEINENFGKMVAQLLIDKKFKNVNIVKDINEKDRIVSCNIE